jgi:hypothetical protein
MAADVSSSAACLRRPILPRATRRQNPHDIAPEDFSRLLSTNAM